MNNRKIVIKNMKNVNEKTTTDLDVSSHLDSKENKSVYLTNIKRLFDLNSKSRQDLYEALKLILEKYQHEFEQRKMLDDKVESLINENKQLETVKADLFAVHENYTKELIRNEKLNEIEMILKKRLDKIVTLLPSLNIGEQQRNVLLELTRIDEDNYKRLSNSVQLDELVKEKRQSITQNMKRLSSSWSERATRSLRDSLTLFNSNRKESNASNSLYSTSSSLSDHGNHQFTMVINKEFNSCSICKMNIGIMCKCYICIRCQSKIDYSCKEKQIPFSCIGMKTLTLESLITTCKDLAVPELIRKCCEHIEQNGLEHENLYQVENDCDANNLLEKYLSERLIEPLRLNRQSILTVSSLVLLTMKRLDDALIGNTYWTDFAIACDNQGDHELKHLLKQLVTKLDRPRRHTLAFLLLHLKKVLAKNYKNKLNKERLAILFGPIIVTNQSQMNNVNNVKAKEQIERARKQSKIVLTLFDISSDFLKDILNDTIELANKRQPINRRSTINYSEVMNERQRESFTNKANNSLYL
ncbi:Rac GTPase-activating protein 1 [Blomia tropicalis]|nr:Rac GTPase-activating protein 1 [Blomia tropicalis]